MTVPRVMCPEDVASAAHEAARSIVAEIDKLNQRFHMEHPDVWAAAVAGRQAIRDRNDLLGSDAAIAPLRDSIGKIIAYEVMVVPIVPDSKPWDGKENLAHAVARFGLLIRDMVDRFPIIIDEDREAAWVFLTERCREITAVLQSFLILTSDPHGCRMLDAIETELKALGPWVKSAPEIEVRKRLTATLGAIQAWAHPELKHLDSIAHAGEVHSH